MKQLTIQTMLSITLLLSTAAQSAHGQFSYRETVGTENAIPYFEPISQEQVGLDIIRRRGAIISNPGLTRSATNPGRLTRHSSTRGTTGIGGSTLQTESVTSESGPALVRPSSISVGTPLITRPTTNSGLETLLQSPALRGYTVQYPSVDEPNFFGRAPETFTTSTLLTSPQQGFSPTTDYFQFGD